MTRVALLAGAPGSALLLLARELERSPRVRVLFPWNVGGALGYLREATEQRSEAWRGPLAEREPWTARAEELFARELVSALVTREQRAHPGVELLVLGHFELATRAARLRTLLPEAHWIVCASDGRIPAAGRVPEGGTERERALAGLAWARSWHAALAPAVELARGVERAVDPTARVATRMHLLHDAELAAEPDATKARLLAELGIDTDPRWLGTRPWTREPSNGAVLEGFACSVAAQRLQESLGHPRADPGELARSDPSLASAFAIDLAAHGELDRADAVLARFSVGTDAEVEHARGELASRQGRGARAVEHWLAAVELAPDRPEAWERLLALADEPRVLAIAARARRSVVARARRALARWLVARGLDAEAAELVARVEHTPWAGATALAAPR